MAKSTSSRDLKAIEKAKNLLSSGDIKNTKSILFSYGFGKTQVEDIIELLQQSMDDETKSFTEDDLSSSSFVSAGFFISDIMGTSSSISASSEDEVVEQKILEASKRILVISLEENINLNKVFINILSHGLSVFKILELFISEGIDITTLDSKLIYDSALMKGYEAIKVLDRMRDLGITKLDFPLRDRLYALVDEDDSSEMPEYSSPFMDPRYMAELSVSIQISTPESELRKKEIELGMLQLRTETSGEITEPDGNYLSFLAADAEESEGSSVFTITESEEETESDRKASVAEGLIDRSSLEPHTNPAAAIGQNPHPAIPIIASGAESASILSARIYDVVRAVSDESDFSEVHLVGEDL